MIHHFEPISVSNTYVRNYLQLFVTGIESTSFLRERYSYLHCCSTVVSRIRRVLCPQPTGSTEGLKVVEYQRFATININTWYFTEPWKSMI